MRKLAMGHLVTFYRLHSAPGLGFGHPWPRLSQEAGVDDLKDPCNYNVLWCWGPPAAVHVLYYQSKTVSLLLGPLLQWAEQMLQLQVPVSPSKNLHLSPQGMAVSQSKHQIELAYAGTCMVGLRTWGAELETLGAPGHNQDPGRYELGLLWRILEISIKHIIKSQI